MRSWIAAAAGVLVLAGCGSSSPPVGASSESPTSTTIVTSGALQQVVKDVSEPLISDFHAATPPQLPADDTYYQQWQAAQPFIGDTLAAEHELDQVHWPTSVLAAESKVYSDLQQMHDLVAAHPEPNLPGADKPFSATFGTYSDAMFGDLQTFLAAVQSS